jgi:hypothetical protein
VGDDGDISKVHGSSSGSDKGESAISPENRDPLFRIALENLEFEGAHETQTRHPDHDAIKWNRILILSLCLSMIFSENRFPLFRIML